MTPALIKVLNGEPAPQQTLVWRHENRIVVKHCRDRSCISSQDSLEIGIGSRNDGGIVLFYCGLGRRRNRGPKCGYGEHAKEREDYWKQIHGFLQCRNLAALSVLLRAGRSAWQNAAKGPIDTMTAPAKK